TARNGPGGTSLTTKEEGRGRASPRMACKSASWDVRHALRVAQGRATRTGSMWALSLVEEQLATDDGADDVTGAVAAGARFVEDLLDCRTVAEANRCAGRVDR